MLEYTIDNIGGYCPVQAEGTVDGKPFYFRARHNSWSMSIGGVDVIGAPEWYMERYYGSEPYAAGWMDLEEAKKFIQMAVETYERQGKIPGSDVDEFLDAYSAGQFAQITEEPFRENETPGWKKGWEDMRDMREGAKALAASLRRPTEDPSPAQDP